MIPLEASLNDPLNAALKNPDSWHMRFRWMAKSFWLGPTRMWTKVGEYGDLNTRSVKVDHGIVELADNKHTI